MRMNVCFVAALLSGALLHAQSQQPPVREPDIKRKAYVRRVSLGATMSVMGFTFVPNREVNTFVGTPIARDTLYTTADATQRVGYGATAQLVLTERFALSAGLMSRRGGYTMERDIIEGVDNPNTAEDDRTHIIRQEDTRFRFYDLPVMVRYYAKDRHDKGPRFFLEGGGVLRRVSHVRSSTSTQVGDEDKTCCDTTPTAYARRTIRGFSGGFGLQFIDDFGIRVVPGMRYTRWAGQTFDATALGTRRNQLEVTLSIMF